MQKGRAEGRAEGEKKGELLGVYKVGLALLSLGQSIEVVANATQLTPKAVQQLATLSETYGTDAPSHLHELLETKE